MNPKPNSLAVETVPDAGPIPTFDELASHAADLSAALVARGWSLASAESCTGGLIGAVCTSLAGSSGWYERGFITYSNEAKIDSLGVEPTLIASHGAVSREVAEAMAIGALARSKAHISVAVTGIAGPGGGTPDKPVGTVWIAAATGAPGTDAKVESQLLQLDGDRSAVRARTVQRALALLASTATAVAS
ncbi:hypothetical protein BH09PSE5_BH09PSE5_35080 [soil metagenome]